MRHIYWTSQEILKARKRQPEDLLFFFEFLGMDLETAGHGKIQEIRKKLAAGALEPLALGKEEGKAPYLELQHHIRGRIEKIITTSRGFWDDKLMNVEIHGSLGIRILPRGGIGVNGKTGDRFIETFTPSIDESVDRITRAKALMDLWLADLIRDLGLQPSRFRVCAKCGRYFYQPTSRRRNYCSRKCAGAVRQARYEKRKRLEKGGTTGTRQAEAK